MKKVEVEWDDHTFEFGTDKPKLSKITTLGYLVEEDAKKIIVAQSIDDDGEPHEMMYIDKRMFRRKRVIG